MTDSPTPVALTSEQRRALFDQRVLVLDGALDDDNGTVLMTHLVQLATADPWNDIALWIHSPGGSVPTMLALRDLMQVIPNDVSTLAFGIACSAGPLLLSSGAPSKRRALPHSRIIVHQGSAGIGGRWTWRCGQTTSGTPAATASWTSTRTCSANGSSGSVPRSMLASPSALIAQRLFREPDSPDSKVQISVNCDSGDPPRHRNHMCGAGTRCRSRPARRGSRREAVRTAARLGRAPPARSPGTGAIPTLIREADEAVRICRDRDVLTVDSGRRVDRLRAGSDHDRVLTARQAQQ